MQALAGRLRANWSHPACHPTGKPGRSPDLGHAKHSMAWEVSPRAPPRTGNAPGDAPTPTDQRSMQVGQFPASAAPSLIEGYCDDFVSLSAVLAQTLEQVSIRGIKLDRSRASLERLERGMREMASAIEELLARGAVTSDFEVALNRPKKESAADALAAAMAAPAPPPAPAPTPAPTRAAAKPPAPPAPVQPPVASAAPARKAPPRAPAPTPPPPAPAPTPPAAKRPAAPPQAPIEPPAPPAPPPARPMPPAAAAQRPMPRPAAVPRAAAPVPDQPAPAANASIKSSPMRTRFESLERDRRNGTLYVQAGQETLAFEFVEGCITQTASDGVVADERLGDLLVELRSCTREQLGTVFARMGADDLHLLGEVLVREGVVTNRQVVEALEKQVQRRVQRACSTPNARFDFAEGELLPDDGRVRVAPSALFRSLDRPHG